MEWSDSVDDEDRFDAYDETSWAVAHEHRHYSGECWLTNRLF